MFSFINGIAAINVTQLFIYGLILGMRLKRRRLFPLRAVLSGVISIGIAYFFPAFTFDNYALDVALASTTYLIFAAMTSLVMFFCFDCLFEEAVVLMCFAYISQHFVSGISNLTQLLLGAMGVDTTADWLIFTVLISLSLLFAPLLYFIGRKPIAHIDFKVRSGRMRALFIGVLTANIFLSSCVVTFFYEAPTAIIPLFFLIYDIVVTCFLSYFSAMAISERKLENDLSVVQELLREKAKQYEFSKESMEAINIKCHDLKYRIRSLIDTNSISEDSLKDIESEIDIYDCRYDTGNEILNTVLMENSLLCNKNGITFSVVADGKALDFMEVYDLYALIGNAVSNAIEAVMKLDEPEKRDISLLIRGDTRTVSIHMENYFQGVLLDEQGNMKTTKEDRLNHGFGVKSMRFIARKYGGDLVYGQDGDIFMTDILLYRPS